METRALPMNTYPPLPGTPATRAQAPAGSLASKRIRIRKCGAKLRVPADPTTGRGEVVFVCTLEKHPQDEAHTEIGFVVMGNETVRRYTTIWTDEGVAVLRQRANKAPRPKVRTLTA